MKLAALVVALAATAASALYIPSVDPEQYAYEAPIPVSVVKVTSAKRQLPFRYYSLPMCTPEEVQQEPENIGQVLAGSRIENSDYKLFTRVNEFCKMLCRKVWSPADAQKVVDFIEDEYIVHMMLDNLPVVVRNINPEDATDVRFDRGFPLGFTVPGQAGAATKHYVFNHLHFTVQFHSDASYEGVRIVGFEVEPFSVQHSYLGEEWRADMQLSTCNPAQHVSRDMPPMSVDAGGEVIFTYDVMWEESSTPWAQRWDVYLSATAGSADLHWFSIINSVVVVLFLSGVIATVLVRALYKDIAAYNDDISEEEREEERGWKLVHGDVFRPPSGFFGPMFLSVFVGAGAQLVCSTFGTLLLAAAGFLSPAHRGSFLSAVIILYMLTGAVAGYASARMYKTFRGKAWKRNTLLTAFAMPGAVFGAIVFLNFFVWGEGSSMAIPFFTLLGLFLLWFGVSTPLVFLGSFLGFRKEEMKQPCRVKQIPRQVPEQVWYTLPLPSILMGGMLPFGAVFVELFFVMSSIWQQHTYYVFGFLGLVFLILLITCAEIAIVMTYFQLCAEDYNWWWRSFLTPASSAVYVFLYSILYYATRLDIEAGTPTLLYFSYMAIACWGLFLLTGSVGFLSTLWFNRAIYSAIHVD